MSKHDSRLSKVTAAIDLHGYRKPEGISILTSFLDQISRRHKNGEVWVTVVTGSGAHSHEGPVLRSAVQALLEKREMIYTVNRGKGSFTVKANSGFVLYPPEAPKDTKVILRNAPEKVPALPKPSNRTILQGALINNDPLPAEVAATDTAVEESRKDQQKVLKETKKEEKMLTHAVSMSLLHAKEEEKEDEIMMTRALSLSTMESTRVDDVLQQALELSQQELQMEESDDSELQRALELSQKVSCPEDEELLLILEQSKREFEQESWSHSLQVEAEEEEMPANVASLSIG